jgi:hypothetical protein
VAYEVLIADRLNATVEDVTGIAFDLRVSPRKNRPSFCSFRVPTHLLSGGNTLRTGDRRAIVRRNGAVVANDILWVTEAVGDHDTGYADVRGFGPMIRWRTRWLQDANGQIFDGPSNVTGDRGLDFPAGALADPDMAASGGRLLKEAVDNTIANDGEIGVVTAGGTFSLTSPPAPNLRTRWGNLTPLRLSEFASMLFDSDVVDAVIQPTAPAGQATQGILSAVTAAGVDRPGVHFQYGTGAKNCSDARIVEAMDDFANKLRWLLGARDGSHFANSVDSTLPEVTVDDTASRAQYGVYHDIVIHDSFSGKIPTRQPAFPGQERPWTGDLRPAYAAYVSMFQAELGYRVRPRKIISVTPQAGLGLAPWDDLQLGDTVRCSIVGLGDDILNATVRVHGWNAMPDNDSSDLERYELLLVSDDE